MDKYYKFLKQAQDEINRKLKHYNHYINELTLRLISYKSSSYYKYFKTQLDFFNKINQDLNNIMIKCRK